MDVDRIRRGRVELRLRRLRLDREDAQIPDVARRLEIGRARSEADGGEDGGGAHQNFPFTPKVGRMGSPEMLPWSRKR